MTIHATALLDSSAVIDPSATIGAYSIVEAGVVVAQDTVIGSHVIIGRNSKIGKGNKISSFVSIGTPPQDIHYNDEATTVEIGDYNQIREYVSIHRGTVNGLQKTVIGNHNMLMAYCHVAHDCVLGDHVILANAATLAGHVTIEDYANVGGLTAVHQFCHIGTHAYIGGMSGLSLDVAPFLILAGIRNQMRVSGINKVGLLRRGFASKTIQSLEKSFKIIFKTPNLILRDALEKAQEEFGTTHEVVQLITFIRQSKRGIIRPVNNK